MSKAEDRALEAYPEATRDITGFVIDIGHPQYIRDLFIEGYHQAEKDLLGNKHEISWRLDEKLWKGIKNIEEASYQYMYDASNDWAYEFPTWKDVQDAFKAGSEWKEDIALSWKDIANILDVTDIIANDNSMEDRLETMSQEEYCKEVLKRFLEMKTLNNKK